MPFSKRRDLSQSCSSHFEYDYSSYSVTARDIKSVLYGSAIFVAGKTDNNLGFQKFNIDGTAEAHVKINSGAAWTLKKLGVSSDGKIFAWSYYTWSGLYYETIIGLTADNLESIENAMRSIY